MEKALKVISELAEKGLIERYAIGGAVASLFYLEPSLTYDLDVFVFLAKSERTRAPLSPIYDYLRRKGFREKREHVLIGGVPVQLIPAYNPLVEEAVRQAREVTYKGVKTKVLLAEYLAAIMLDTGRPKDKIRLAALLEQAAFNRKKFERMITQHGLTEKWEQFKR